MTRPDDPREELPKTMFMSRIQVQRALGIGNSLFEQMRDEGRIRPVVLARGSNPRYRTSSIRKLINELEQQGESK